MSILIKDMDMPSCCSDCPLNYDQMSCLVTGTRWWSDTMVMMDFDPSKERLYDCPLKETQSEPKTGKWTVRYECPNCGEGRSYAFDTCPMCGAKMEGEQDE